ncbi:MAG: helix-turn-helix domain-containing protein [Vulcanimicrobiaceae bacterium]
MRNRSSSRSFHAHHSSRNRPNLNATTLPHILFITLIMTTRNTKDVPCDADNAALAEDVMAEARESLRINVIAQRARMRFTQRDLSKRSGVARAVVSKMENGDGDFNVSTVAKIASVVGCSVADLLTPTVLAPVGSLELRRRFASPRAEWAPSDDLFAALEEVHSRGKPSATAGSMARGVSSGGAKSSPGIAVI